MTDAYIYDALRTPRGKGRKERLALLGGPAQRALKDYLSDPRRPKPKAADTEAVFLNARGGRLTTGGGAGVEHRNPHRPRALP